MVETEIDRKDHKGQSSLLTLTVTPQSSRWAQPEPFTQHSEENVACEKSFLMYGTWPPLYPLKGVRYHAKYVEFVRMFGHSDIFKALFLLNGSK